MSHIKEDGMKLGLHINDMSWPGGASQLGPTLVQIAQAADAGGFDRLSVGDHVWQSHFLGGPEREVLACYPTLAYLAAHTSRIKLLALATAAPYWQPVLLAKTVTTLDVLSGGRAWPPATPTPATCARDRRSPKS